MPQQARYEVATLPKATVVASATQVAVAVEGCADGEEGVTWQLVRLAPRRCEILATRWAAIVRHGGRLTALFAVALVISALSALPRVMCDGPSKVDVTRLRLKKYAFEAYPSWSMEHPERPCPRSFHELAEYMNEDDDRDAWGNRLEVRCGDDLPAGAQGMWLRSAGEDGRFDTDDDLDSSQ